MEHPVLIEVAPWLQHEAVNHCAQWIGFLITIREVPGGIPERAIISYKLRNRVAIPRADVL